MNDVQTKFEALAGFIEASYEHGGMEAVMVVPTPLVHVLRILHEASGSEVPEVRDLIAELFNQVNGNVGSSFSFKAWGSTRGEAPMSGGD